MRPQGTALRQNIDLTRPNRDRPGHVSSRAWDGIPWDPAGWGDTLAAPARLPQTAAERNDPGESNR